MHGLFLDRSKRMSHNGYTGLIHRPNPQLVVVKKKSFACIVLNQLKGVLHYMIFCASTGNSNLHINKLCICTHFCIDYAPFFFKSFYKTLLFFFLLHYLLFIKCQPSIIRNAQGFFFKTRKEMWCVVSII